MPGPSGAAAACPSKRRTGRSGLTAPSAPRRVRSIDKVPGPFPPIMALSPETTQALAEHWHRLSAATVRAFHRYGTWLVSLSWWRFTWYSLLLVVAASIMESLPPFSWSYTETVTDSARHPRAREKTAAPALPAAPVAASHTRAVLSKDTVTMRVPSGLNDALETASSCCNGRIASNGPVNERATALTVRRSAGRVSSRVRGQAASASFAASV